MNDPVIRFAGDRPYTDSFEYVEELSVFVDLRILEIMLERRSLLERNGSQMSVPHDTAAGDTVLLGQESTELPRCVRAIEYLHTRLVMRGLTEGQTAQLWADQIIARRDVSVTAGKIPALNILLERLSLPDWMTETLIYYYHAYLDRDYASTVGVKSLYDVVNLLFGDGLHGGARVSRMLSEAADSLGYLFPECDGAEDIFHLTPQLDRRLYELMTDEANGFAASASAAGFPTGLTYGRIPDAAQTSLNLPYGMHMLSCAVSRDDSAQDSPYAYMRDDRERLARRLRSYSAPIVLWGARGAGKHTIATGALADAGMRAIEYDAGECLNEANAAGDISVLMDHTLYAVRECVVTDRMLVISGLGGYSADRHKLYISWLTGKAGSVNVPVCMLIDTETVPDYIEDVYLFAVKLPDAVTRARIWAYYLRGYSGDRSLALSEGEIQQLANSFTLTPGQINRAARQAFLHEDVSRGMLYKSCYAVMGHPLKDHTQKVESPFKWDDIKMDPKDKTLLRDVCDTVRNRHIVMQEWNFESKVPYGSGVTVLFAGPPGTGKTMAAQVVANELGMELYKIDLSQLIDKYVGETEKNIRRIFDQAKKSNSVLFFDEADSIFNKRMDAKDANERFANIESSLLLQCIEEFDGISILATNNMTSIDNAFLRRFRYYLLFKEPDEQIRYEIWSSVFPKQAPVASEVDYRELARIFKFTGAIIKNVALTAAYLAAAQGVSIGLLEIMVAIRREMEKNHRILTKEEMGSLGYLFARVCER